MTETISISSALIAPRASTRLTPAMVAVLWELAALIDERRDIATSPRDAVWIEAPTTRLRRGGRSDNVWLREMLDRLLGVRIDGEQAGDPWGAVLLAQYEIQQGGSWVRLLVPPAAVAALRAPQTFAQVEAAAVHRLTGHGRRLYVLLADRRRQARPSWTYSLDDLRRLLGVEDRPSYRRWGMLRQWVLEPALAQIAEFGTVEVRMTPMREGRAVNRVRFDWSWRSPQDAAAAVAEAERHSVARRRSQDHVDAPPLVPPVVDNTPVVDTAAVENRRVVDAWWSSLDDSERDRWRDDVGRTLGGVGHLAVERRDRDIAADAWRRAHHGARDA